MANKQYISPIRLFDYCSVDFEDGINSSRIKKHLTAEFGMAASGMIEIESYVFNKSDVFEEIEKPDFEKRLDYHRKIWKNKNLLALLENNVFNYQMVQMELNQFENDPAFDEFFSPYFSVSFYQVSRNLLYEKDLYQLSNLLLFENFLLAEDREAAFKAIRIFLEETLHSFKNISKENYFKFRPKIENWVKEDWSYFVNNLPAEFYDFKFNIAFNLINLTVKIQKSAKKDCKIISRELVNLTGLNPELRGNILNNDKVFNGGGVVGFNYRWLFWIAIIAMRIIASGGCH